MGVTSRTQEVHSQNDLACRIPQIPPFVPLSCLPHSSPFSYQSQHRLWQHKHSHAFSVFPGIIQGLPLPGRHPTAPSRGPDTASEPQVESVGKGKGAMPTPPTSLPAFPTVADSEGVGSVKRPASANQENITQVPSHQCSTNKNMAITFHLNLSGSICLNAFSCRSA